MFIDTNCQCAHCNNNTTNLIEVYTILAGHFNDDDRIKEEEGEDDDEHPQMKFKPEELKVIKLSIHFLWENRESFIHFAKTFLMRLSLKTNIV